MPPFRLAEVLYGMPAPSRGMLVAIAGVLVYCAVRFRPSPDDPVRRCLWKLLLLPIPWMLAVVFGPLGLLDADPSRRDAMLLGQNVALVASVILPLALLPQMRGGRRLTLSVGALNLMLSLVVNGVSLMGIAPGS